MAVSHEVLEQKHLLEQASSAPHEYPSWDEFLETSEIFGYKNIRSVNARPWVLEMRNRYGNDELTIASFTDEMWDELTFDNNIDAVYVIGIYESSEAARLDSIQYLPYYRHVLEDDTLPEEEVYGSCFAQISNNLHPMVANSWDEWRERVYEPLQKKGIELGVDYIPNHVALDHPWRDEHPEYLLQVDKKIAEAKPEGYFEYTDKQGITHYYARGKHYTVEGKEEIWTDTLQLDFRNPALRKAKIDQLVSLVENADFARVDTAILPVYDIFVKTWGDIVPIGERWYFWEEALSAIEKRARELGKSFRLLGEAYDSGHVLENFYGVYGSSIYGELVRMTNGRGNIHEVRRELQRAYDKAQLGGTLDLLFAENHDLEPTVDIFGSYQRTLAALTVTTMSPGDWLLHYGEELLRRNPPMQVIKPYIDSKMPHLINDLRLQYERWFAIRKSRILQLGTPTLQYPPEDLVVQQYDYQDKGLIICTNLSNIGTGSWIELPEGLTKDDIDVYDLDNLAFVEHSLITDPAVNGHVYVQLEPWHRQIVMYKRKKGGKQILQPVA